MTRRRGDQCPTESHGHTVWAPGFQSETEPQVTISEGISSVSVYYYNFLKRRKPTSVPNIIMIVGFSEAAGDATPGLLCL